MRQKLVLCLLVILVLSIAVVPNLHDNKAMLQPPLQSIETHSDTNMLVLVPNFRLMLHYFLRLRANSILYPSIFKQQIDFIHFDFKNQCIVLFLCHFISLFFIFYQISRTCSKQDGPSLINSLSYKH